MTPITIQVPTTALPRIFTAFSSIYPYTGDGTNASKFAFVKDCLKKDIINTVKNYEGPIVASTATQNNSTDVDTNIVLS